MSKKSKYEKNRVNGWDDSEGVLTNGQIEFLIQDEKRMQAEEIAEELKDSNKLFNSVHIQYETNNPNAQTEPVTESELEEAISLIKPSKYKRSNKWIESSGELSQEEIARLLYIDKIDTEEELKIISDETLNFISENAKRHKVSDKYKNTGVFLDSPPEHPLGKDGLNIAYNNLKNIEIHPDDIDSIK